MAMRTAQAPGGGATPDAAEKKGGARKVILIALIAILAAAGGVAGTYFLFLKEPGPPPPPEPGVMVQMEAMTVTLAEGHFLKIQTAIQLVEGTPAETFETIKASQLIIDTFSNLDMDELTTNAARKDLTAQLLTGLKQAYPEEVYDVYLTQFVIQ